MKIHLTTEESENVRSQWQRSGSRINRRLLDLHIRLSTLQPRYIREIVSEGEMPKRVF